MSFVTSSDIIMFTLARGHNTKSETKVWKKETMEQFHSHDNFFSCRRSLVFVSIPNKYLKPIQNDRVNYFHIEVSESCKKQEKKFKYFL